MSYCTRCGAGLSPDASFCSGCGSARSLGTNTPEAASRPAPLPPPSPPAAEASSWRVLTDWVRFLGVAGGDVRRVVLGAIAAAVVVVSLVTVVVGIVAASSNESSARGSLIEWARVGVALAQSSVHGAVTMTDPTVDGVWDANGQAFSITVGGTLILGTVLTVAVLWGMARWLVYPSASAPFNRSKLIIAAVGGATFGLTLFVLAIAAQGEGSIGTSNSINDAVRIEAISGRGLLGGTVIGTLGILLASRLSHAVDHPQSQTARAEVVTSTLRHVRVLSVAVMVLAIVATVAALIIDSGDAVWRDADVGLGAVFLLAALPNLVLVFAGAGQGATIAQGGVLRAEDEFGIGDGIGLLAGGVDGWAYWSLLVMALVATLAGVQRALRSAPSALRQPAVWWTTPIAFAGVWAVIWLLTRITALGPSELGPDVDGSIGLGLPSLLLMTAIWSILSVGAGLLLTPLLAASFPRSAALLGGRRLHPAWATALNFQVQRQGRTPSRALAVSAARGDAETPTLGPGHGALIGSVAALVAVTGLLLSPVSEDGEQSLSVVAQFRPSADIPPLEPSAAQVDEWEDKQDNVEAADAEAAELAVAAGPGWDLVAQQETTQVEIDTREGEIDDLRDQEASALEVLEDPLNDLSYLEAAVESSKEFAREFAEYDLDGYWADTLAEDEAALAEARIPVDAANADLAAARQRLTQIDVELAGLRAQEEDLESQIAGQQGAIDAATDATASAEELAEDLADAKEAWHRQRQADRTDAAATNAVLGELRQEALPRTVAAALLVLLTAVLLVRRRLAAF